jgi:hypothetical protein
MFSITEKAIDFMKEKVLKKKPFYLQISHYAMHAGFECLPETRVKWGPFKGERPLEDDEIQLIK